MKEIFEIRIHGRAGQGAKTMAQFIVEAAMKEQKFIQAFPSYSADREGEPLNAFVRISEKPILIHSQIENPDVVIVIDPTLIEAENVTAGLSSRSGILIVNTGSTSKEISKKLKFYGKIYVINASKISFQFLGKNFPNIVLLGVFARVTNQIKFSNLEEVVKVRFLTKLGKKLTEANLQAMRAGYNIIKRGSEA
jgi:pyruvate ferredoxin oxidoreductase gamma subunit